MSGVKRIYDVMRGTQAMTPQGVSFGTVTSIEPLIITREGETARVPLTEGFLVLSRLCRKLSIKATHTHTIDVTGVGAHTHGVAADGAHSHTAQSSEELTEIVVWGGLEIGEVVVLLPFGQKFFVERLGGIE